MNLNMNVPQPRARLMVLGPQPPRCMSQMAAQIRAQSPFCGKICMPHKINHAKFEAAAAIQWFIAVENAKCGVFPGIVNEIVPACLSGNMSQEIWYFAKFA